MKIILISSFRFILLAAALWSFSAPFASAHRLPANCSGSGLAINLYANVTQVQVGGSISYSVEIFNGSSVGPVVCDATAIQASLTTPDGVVHVIPLVRNALSAGQIDFYPNVVVYVSRAQDISQNGLFEATAQDSGVIHQNTNDSNGGGFQGLNVTISNTPPPPSPPPVVNTGTGVFALLPLIHVTKIPAPTELLSGPGLVTFTYAVTNVGPIPMGGVWAKDDRCSPLIFISGDANKDSMLDLTEVWTYRCSKVLNVTETNVVTAHGSANGWDTYDTAAVTVVVNVPDVFVPPLLASVFIANPIIPTFPNTGFYSSNSFLAPCILKISPAFSFSLHLFS